LNAWHLVGVVLLAAMNALAQEKCSNRQTPAEVDARIDRLIGRMTLAEKISQLGDRAPAVPRVGLPGYNWWNEGLHGLARDGYATVFPQAIGLAATWDASLIHEIGDTVSTEARAKYNAHRGQDTERYGGLTIWSPNINIFRDPRWGRGQETYGDDPFLTGMLGTEFIRGVQGDDPFYRKADATPKHFAAHSGPEKGRDSFNAEVSAHDLADTYLPAFHAAITRGGAAALMCSYNAIDGTPSCAKYETLGDEVRGEWSFRGYVVSDCDAVGNITEYQHFTKDAAHGAAAALKAGVDLDCGHSYEALNQSVAQGLVSEAEVNRALHRLLLARVELGMMDAAECTPWGAISAADNDTPEHRALALKAAAESAVLLKNDGVLPLRAGMKLAVIGPTADMLKVLEANYHGTASHPVTPLEGIEGAFPNVRYAQGSLLADGLPVPIPGSVLRQGAAADAPQGLLAEYFEGASFRQKASVTGSVTKVDLDYDRTGPVPAIKSKQWAVRWSGFLAPPAAGEYVLRVDVERCWDCTAHDAYRLLVDGKEVVGNDGSKAQPDRATLHFADAAPHAVQLELVHAGDDEGIALEWIPPTEALLAEAEKVAEGADAILAFVGLSPDLEGEALQLELPGFAGGDRTSLALPQAQQTLLARLRATGKPVIAVLASGSAVALDPAQSGLAAMVEAWYPGEAGGEAIASLLGGKVNFSGRLPVTFPRSVDDLPAFTDYSMAHRTYRYFDGPVLFPFGYGLSYTKFAYGPMKLDQATVKAGAALTGSVTVRNVGAVAGTEVVEMYVAPPHMTGAPRLALAGCSRVALKPGESRMVRIRIEPEQLSFVDAAGHRAVRAGRYRLFVGGVQPDVTERHGSGFRIVGEKPSDF
jgi:beta-glucosidase